MKQFTKKDRIFREKQIVTKMLIIYCRDMQHGECLCPKCKELLSYAHHRLDKCPFGENKSKCKNCTIHCYKPTYREEMRKVMRHSGIRMLWHSPIEAIKHLLEK